MRMPRDLWAPRSAALGVLLLSSSLPAQVTERVSVSSAGAQGTDSSSCEATSLSADGTLMAFESTATNLVPGDTNGNNDIFVRDIVAGTTTRVSVSSTGVQGNDVSVGPSVSGDGRFVAWQSQATNLVPMDTSTPDAFVRDRLLNKTTRVSVSGAGVRGNGSSGAPRLSHDGRFVAFLSVATNLVAGDTNGRQDIFVRDRDPDGNGTFDEGSDTTELISVASSGTQSDAASVSLCLSATGRYVAFESGASNLVPGDTNGTSDLFVRDRVSHTTERVSVDSAGAEGNGISTGLASISSDGRLVVFQSRASNLVPGDTNAAFDIFLRDRVAQTTRLVSAGLAGLPGNAPSERPAISPDGRWIVFQSSASNLVPGDTNAKEDVFMHDLGTSVTTRVSLSTSGTQADGDSSHFAPSLSADGRYVAFGSRATNLVGGDTNAVEDVFVRDRGCPHASASFRNAGSNPGSFTCSAPVPGANWSGTVDLTTTGHSLAYIYAFAAPTTSILPQGQVLLGSGQIARLGPVAGPLASFSFAVPIDQALCGLHLTTQALHLGTVSPFATSNAMDLVVGQ